MGGGGDVLGSFPKSRQVRTTLAIRLVSVCGGNGQSLKVIKNVTNAICKILGTLKRSDLNYLYQQIHHLLGSLEHKNSIIKHANDDNAR